MSQLGELAELNRPPPQGHWCVPGGGLARSGKAVLAMTERLIGNVVVYDFPVSTFVNIVRLVLTEKGVPFNFYDRNRRWAVRVIW